MWSEWFFPAQRTAWVVLAASLGLDYLLADPWGWPHPVRVMGAAITVGQRWILKYCRTAQAQRWGGAGLALVLVMGSYGVGWGLMAVGDWIHPWVGILVQIILLASCLGGRSLRLAALEVLDPLEKGDLPGARQRLSRYVGRDTENLSAAEILRAVLETVAENTPDGATAPLFYAFLGGAPLALAYKAVSTLDSMVGYRRAPFTHLGLVSARCEDGLTWLPCRLTVLTLALLSRDPCSFWARCRQDARADPSPNSGWSEAAFAWRLGIQLGGTNVYQGIPKEKPKLGIPARALSPQVVLESLGILRQILLIWGGGMTGILLMPHLLPLVLG
ncbi:adenosylcobinamide-phosphate synthase CbiB [Thermostichus vulcanus]|uniref:adenosylcobinamide-phosphate synthase CbiB n=1 Tax=Thermostichus vulcanus TaxID=32053 RepID=UPI001FCC46D3|nr:adenosylcobinamide-phosphate synthase CbiB [Thermostichus vulcanus]